VTEEQELLADLCGVFEIATRLGVDRKRVYRWIERRASTGAPEPKLRLRGEALYSYVEWRGWYALWRVTRAPQSTED
jgi:hypothetical protein